MMTIPVISIEAKHGDGVVALGIHYTTQPSIISGCSVAIISLYIKEYQLMLEAYTYLHTSYA